MQPKHLKCPFKWATRHPLICDRVLYVPEYYHQHEEFVMPGWESDELFGRLAPIEVEYCAGNGAWILDRALKYPELNFVAVEMQFERVRKIWSKIQNYQLKNLIVVCGEALTFTRYYAKRADFSAAYVNFPDPWPKEKHTKHRLLQEPFFEELSRVCQPQAPLTIATDHEVYAAWAIAGLERSEQWSSCYPTPHYVLDYPDYGTSYFDALFRDQGRQIYYIKYLNL